MINRCGVLRSSLITVNLSNCRVSVMNSSIFSLLSVCEVCQHRRRHAIVPPQLWLLCVTLQRDVPLQLRGPWHPHQVSGQMLDCARGRMIKYLLFLDYFRKSFFRLMLPPALYISHLSDKPKSVCSAVVFVIYREQTLTSLNSLT